MLTITPGESLLRLPQVQERTGMSRSDIYRKAQSGQFPKPLKLTERASAWRSSEIDRWIAERIAARDERAVA